MDLIDEKMLILIGTAVTAVTAIIALLTFWYNVKRDKTILDITLTKVDDFDDTVKQVQSYQAGNGIDKMPMGSQGEPIYLVNITNIGMQPTVIKDYFILPYSKLDSIRPKLSRTLSNSIAETYDFNESQMLEIPSKASISLPLYLYHGKPLFEPKKIVVIDGENKQWSGKLSY